MRMNHMSLNRKWILFSLVLLSPAILAAENLNFNYTRADALSMDSRLGLQAKACHSKGDPMDIRVRFDSISVGGSFNVTLAIQGAEYPKSYSVFTKAVQSKQSGADPDFMVPWRINVKGRASGSYTLKVHNPGTSEAWGDIFCFSTGGAPFPDRNQYPHTAGLKPIFSDDPRYKKYCSNKPLIYNDYYSWGGNPETTDIPGKYKDDYPPENPGNLLRPDQRFLIGNIKFFTSHTPAKPATDDWATSGFGNSVEKEFSDKKFIYRFPLGAENNKGVHVDNGDFLLRLNNRNISALTLTVTYGGVSEVWSWKAANDDAYKNRLYLNHQAGLGIKPSSSDASDPYLINKFYKENRYYKGTLTPGVYLTSAYTDYIRNIMPLSLPSTSDGEINLVNTDSLIFTIGQTPSSGGYESILFRAYGQPLKFAPLTVNGKEVASAMQVRNACY